jgi:hypothetical protein
MMEESVEINAPLPVVWRVFSAVEGCARKENWSSKA